MYQNAFLTKMGQKLGFLITKPPKSGQSDGFSGVKKVLFDETEEIRELSAAEIDCIASLLGAMTQTGSDFTDTFRVLGKVKTYSGDNQLQILKELESICAPPKFWDKEDPNIEITNKILKLQQVLELPELLEKARVRMSDVQNELNRLK